jgi:hypothetical protein
MLTDMSPPTAWSYDLPLATRHADDALRLMTAWDIPLCADWFRSVRATYSF